MKRYGKGVVLKPETADVTENAEGSLWSNSTEQRMKTYIEGAVRQLVTNNQTQTLENKTIVAANNTITTAASGNLVATELNAALAELQGSIDDSNTDLSNHLSDATDAHDASAISVVPTGNLAASDVQAALNELQGDADSAATHIAASTDVHGLSGGAAVVGTTSAQTLTNKTLTGASIQTPFRSDVKQDTKANLVTYALTASNGQLVFATDTKELLQVLDGVLSAVGGGGIGGVDILFVQDFEAAALSDFTQTGLSLSTSSPLHGDVSALLTHDSVANQSFKQVIAVDRKFRGEAMTMRLNVKSNATAGNVTLNVYDETNAANLVVSEQLQLSDDTSGALNKIAFTIPETCASLSYTVTALPEAGSPVTRVDDIIAELAVTSLLETSVEVPNITAWQGYTPTFQGFGTPSAVEFEWRQVGEDVEIRGKFTSGTSTAVEARVSLPAGLTSSGTDKIPSLQVVGNAARNVISASTNDFSVLIDPSATFVNFGTYNSSISTHPFTKSLATQLINSGEILGFFAKVPCAGLSATTTKTIDLTQSGLVQNPDSNLRVAGNAAQAITASVTNIPFSNIENSIGSDVSFNGSSFTINTNGIYSINTVVAVTASALRALALYKNGVLYKNISESASTTTYGGNLVDYFTSGDVLSFRLTAGATLGGAVSEHFAVISKQNSLKQVSVSSDQKIKIPTSELRMEGASTRGAVATAIVRFDTVAKLRGDAFTVTSTANDGTFVTMRKAGRLSVTTSIVASASNLYLTRNQSVLTAVPTLASEQLAADVTDVNIRTSFGWTGDVAVGDIIRLSASANPTANTSNNLNLSFQEQDIAVSVTNTLPQFSESDLSVKGAGNSGQAITSNVTNIPFQTVEDTTGGNWNGSQFTVPETGLYSISASLYFTTGPNGTINLYKNGTFYKRISPVLTINIHVASGIVENFVAGDVISLRFEGTGTLSNAIQYHWISISKVGKPNVTGVNVTPFVKIPQNDVETVELTGGSAVSAVITNFSVSKNTNKGILSYSAGVLTVLKKCTIVASVRATQSGAGATGIDIRRNGSVLTKTNIAVSTYQNTASCSFVADVGDTLSFGTEGNQNSAVAFITAEAASDSIITASESFSTDTASLQYAGSGAYTLSTLANAPVGTFITYTKGAASNVLTQTTVAPTQTTSDMNVNGILTMLGVTANATTAAAPGALAIQIGKGLKGVTANVYRLSGKTTAGVVSGSNSEGAGASGIPFTYNERTGVLFLTTCTSSVGTVTSWGISFEDNTSATNGTQVYVTFNASKSPALVGVPLLQPRIATISHELASGTSSGTFTSGAYQTRPLNTLVDPTGIVTSLASNQFVLPAGEYYIDASANAKDVNAHKAKLRNITDSTDVILGGRTESNATGGSQSSALVNGRVVITSSKTFELQHRCGTTRATDGFGGAAGFGDTEVYAIVKIQKIK
jgi:hypothetical protein